MKALALTTIICVIALFNSVAQQDPEAIPGPYYEYQDKGEEQPIPPQTEYELVINKIVSITGSPILAKEVVYHAWKQTQVLYQQLQSLEYQDSPCLREIITDQFETFAKIQTKSLSGNTRLFYITDYLEHISNIHKTSDGLKISVSPVIEVDTNSIRMERIQQSLYNLYLPVFIEQYYTRGNYSDKTIKMIMVNFIIDFSNATISNKIKSISVIDVSPI